MYQAVGTLVPSSRPNDPTHPVTLFRDGRTCLHFSSKPAGDPRRRRVSSFLGPFGSSAHAVRGPAAYRDAMPVRVRWVVPAVAVVALASCGGPDREAPPPPAPSAAGAQPSTDAPSGQARPGRTPRTTLTVVGDIMLGRGVAAVNPAADPAAPLRPMRALLHRADLTVGNLESTLSTNGPPQQGDDSFAADPRALPTMARLGFDALSLANNH